MTSFRAVDDSEYLNHLDLHGQTTLTIREAVIGRTPDGSKETLIIHWVEREVAPGEPLRPFICNKTNRKNIYAVVGDKNIESWAGARITIWPDPTVKHMGKTVGGTRVSPEPAEPPEKRPLTPSMKKAWANAQAAVQRDGNLDAVLERFEVSEEHKTELLKCGGTT